MSEWEEAQEVGRLFAERYFVMKRRVEDPRPDLSMALGVLLRAGYPGCAAAVAAIVEETYPGLFEAYVGKDPRA